MKYKIYPKGYDPYVAEGPPSEWLINEVGVNWTPEDTEKMRKMEKECQEIVEMSEEESRRMYVGRWKIPVE